MSKGIKNKPKILQDKEEYDIDYNESSFGPESIKKAAA
jgi:hypothetical protein